MTNLWTLSKFERNTAVLMPGDTLPEMFWNAVAKRGPKVWDCWVEYANTLRGERPFTRTTRATLKAAQAWCAEDRKSVV